MLCVASKFMATPKDTYKYDMAASGQIAVALPAGLQIVLARIDNFDLYKLILVTTLLMLMAEGHMPKVYVSPARAEEV